MVTPADGAPFAALALLVAPIPLAPWIAYTVSDCSNPGCASVDVTATFDAGFGFVAVHTSAVPRWAFVRFASVQVRPPPETEAVCVPAGPSAATWATSSSFGAVVVKDGVARVPVPVAMKERSNTKEACETRGLTGVTTSPVIWSLMSVTLFVSSDSTKLSPGSATLWNQ